MPPKSSTRRSGCYRAVRDERAHRCPLPASRAGGVALECVKKAEDSDGVVLRLWETRGQRQVVSLDLGDASYRVVACDLLENPGTMLSERTSRMPLEFGPFEIKTLLLYP